MSKHKSFWDRNAKIYNLFIRKDSDAYERMYELIRPVVKDKRVLELATGTGLIAKHIADDADYVEATDSSLQMIKIAREGNNSPKLHFSVQDMFSLTYDEEAFDVVIAANVLHIVREPERALEEAKRVLKENGILIAPTFTHKSNSVKGNIKLFFMKLAGFPLRYKWSSEEYLDFLDKNGFKVIKSKVLDASFPLTYADCIKSEV